MRSKNKTVKIREVLDITYQILFYRNENSESGGAVAGSGGMKHEEAGAIVEAGAFEETDQDELDFECILTPEGVGTNKLRAKILALQDMCRSSNKMASMDAISVVVLYE